MDEQVILYVLAFSSVFLGARSLIDFGQEARDKSLVNKRLKAQAETDSIAEAVLQLRRKRGLDEDGNRVIKNAWLGRLVARSGLDYKPASWAAMALAAGAVAAGLGLLFLRPHPGNRGLPGHYSRRAILCPQHARLEA